MVLSEEMRRAKLVRLAAIEGMDVEALLRIAPYDGVSLTICTNESCDDATEMEPDQNTGWCENCGTNSLHSALVLARLM